MNYGLPIFVNQGILPSQNLVYPVTVNGQLSGNQSQNIQFVQVPEQYILTFLQQQQQQQQQLIRQQIALQFQPYAGFYPSRLNNQSLLVNYQSSLIQNIAKRQQIEAFQKQQLNNKQLANAFQSSTAFKVNQFSKLNNQKTQKLQPTLSILNDTTIDATRASINNYTESVSKNEESIDLRDATHFNLLSEKETASRTHFEQQPQQLDNNNQHEELSSISDDNEDKPLRPTQKKNVVKNLVKGFIHYLQNEKNDARVAELCAMDMQEYQAMRKRFLLFIKRRNFNNMLIKDLLKHKGFCEMFSAFLDHHADEWLDSSSVLDKKSHHKMIVVFRTMAHDPRQMNLISVDAKSRRYKK